MAKEKDSVSDRRIGSNLPRLNSDLAFDGSNWEDFSRLVTLTRLSSVFTTIDNEDDKCAYLAQHFVGAALDWVGTQTDHGTDTVFGNFDAFVRLVRTRFGIEDDVVRAHRQTQLDALRWSPDLPVFFSEFDRLTSSIGLTSEEARLAMLRSKLPLAEQRKLADAGRIFYSFETARSHLLTVWALQPQGAAAAANTRSATRPKCGSCGKRGHRAANCKSGKA